MIWPLNFGYYPNGKDNSWKYYLEDMRKVWIWGILIVSGGRFAGAIYHGNEMIAHKTFHRYITHKKRNSARGKNHSHSHQSKSKLSHFHDTGERSFDNDVKRLISSSLWKDYLKNKCDKIFIHACGKFSHSILFNDNGENNIYCLSNKDKRIHNIPITVGVPTLMEVERVHYCLSTCWMDLNLKQDEN